ncbi:MAG: 5-formyltetrahydrofolate cyclo-ligase [Candidatus Kapaibacterium sp.]
MEHSTLRRSKIQERDALDRGVTAEWSVAMADTLTRTFEYQQSESVHLFLSFGSEPLTQPLIERAWNDGKTVYVPSVIIPGTEKGESDVADSKDTAVMMHMRYDRGDDLGSGLYGIPEPVGKPRLVDADVKSPALLAVVPLVAFNELLVRMGYGKGYYDRFLEHRSFFAFGLAFTAAFSSDFQPHAHDARLDAIVTEQGIVRTRRSINSPVSISL